MNSNKYNIKLNITLHSLSFTTIKTLSAFLALLAFFASPNAVAQQRVETAFSPNGGAQALVVRVIESARQEINVMAYSFTSAPVAGALVKAAKRGVKVQVVADYEGNTSGGGASKARSAMSALAYAGASVHLSDFYAIHHDKVLIVDRKHVQTGSFNYSAAAENKNSENVIVLRDSPEIARSYLTHFDRNFKQSQPFIAR